MKMKKLTTNSEIWNSQTIQKFLDAFQTELSTMGEMADRLTKKDIHRILFKIEPQIMAKDQMDRGAMHAAYELICNQLELDGDDPTYDDEVMLPFDMPKESEDNYPMQD